MRLRLALFVFVASCAGRQPPPPVASGTTGSASAPTPGANMSAAVTVTLVGSKPGRPPLERLLVDVQLRNDDTTARWALIPTKVPPETGGGVDKLEQLTVAAGGASVAIGRFLGRAGTYAVKLAPGARVTLRKLEVSWWRQAVTDKETTFDVLLASDVKIGDASMATWFDKDPAITGAADLDMESAKHTRSHKSTDGSEIALVAVDANSAPIKLTP